MSWKFKVKPLAGVFLLLFGVCARFKEGLISMVYWLSDW